MNGVAIGSIAAALGVVGLVAALTSRRMLRDHALMRTSLYDWEQRLQRREAALDRYTQHVHEWAGRLEQVAVCRCDPHTANIVRPDRTPPRGPRPERPPTRRD